MAEDMELQAMATISTALEALDTPARMRILRWAASKYAASADDAGLLTETNPNQPGSGERRFRDFADFYDATVPETETHSAVVAAYWFQVIEGADGLDAQSLNNALKDLGHGMTNITRALTRAQRSSPALVRQIQKLGKAKQARKKYRLTNEGVRLVESMLTIQNGNATLVSGNVERDVMS